MRTSDTRPTREAQALAEIAATRVSRRGAWALSGLLLATITVGALFEAARWRRGESTVFAAGAPFPSPAALVELWRNAGARVANRTLRTALLALEDRLGRESALSQALRPATQNALTHGLAYGNTQVIVGRQGWLYYRTEFDYLTGRPFLAPRELAHRQVAGARYFAPHPDPTAGLLRLGSELADLGITLVFFPVPVKAEVHPEPLVRAPGDERIAGPALGNPSLPELSRRLRSAGIAVYDALPALRAAALRDEVLYPSTDTHWNAHGMRIAAAGLAQFLAREVALAPRAPAGLRRETFSFDFEGDLTRLLGAGGRGGSPRSGPTERLELGEVRSPGGDPLRFAPSPATDILLLGDSYALIYSAVGGRDAGFAGELAFALDRPVSLRAGLEDNDLPHRIGWLREAPQLLAGKRVVIYEVSARALASADWTGGTFHLKSPERSPP